MDRDLGAARNVIGALSVLGDRFDVQLAVDISGLEPADLLQALDDAQREGLLVVEGGLIHFDPGLRARAYEELGSHGQAAAHARAANVLERVRPRDLAAIADQRSGAVAVLGVEPALSALDAAATAAERALDWDAAGRLWQRASDVAARAHDARAGDLAIRRARCLYRDGLFGESLTVCRQVASEARAAGDWRLLADAALVVRGIADRDNCEILLDFCRDALRNVGDDPVLRSRLQSQTIMLSSDLSRVPTEGSEADENVLVAEGSGDIRALVDALHAMQMVAAGPLNASRRLEIADRVERLCLDANLEDDLAWPLAWRVDVYFQLGQRPALDNAIARLEEYADRRRDALATWRATMARAAVAQHEGRFDEAVRLGTVALEMAARGNHQAADFLYRLLVYTCRMKTGQGSFDEVLHGRGGGPDVFPIFWAMVAVSSGDLETAAPLFELALPAMDVLDGSHLQVVTGMAFAMVAWSLDRVDVAPMVYTGLEPFADELAVASSGQATSGGSVSRYLGQMAALMGDWDRVELDFARAMRRNLETGARAEVGETRFDWATALLRRGQARDRERASAMLEAAARDAAELGMEPLRRAAADALATLKGGRSPLTDRELEVAALVAEGLTNKEVATSLRLSVRTAENHVLNVMNKLGLDNRAQVAAWFTRTRATGEIARR
ncbi:MAG TPA: helix-turn-helix transcriptional regulator [Methylomirabilota bacterium]|nr:helix-turn-helix transcriptional regulator [Methylomirabilota bacterium]